MLATTPPIPPSPKLANTKKLKAINPNPTAVSVAASTSNSSTNTSCSPGRDVASSPVPLDRDISVDEYPRAASLSSWDCSSSFSSEDAIRSVFMFDRLRAVVGKAVAPGVHGGDMEKAPTVPVRSATSMMSGAVRRMRSVSAPMFFLLSFLWMAWVRYYLYTWVLAWALAYQAMRQRRIDCNVAFSNVIVIWRAPSVPLQSSRCWASRQPFDVC